MTLSGRNGQKGFVFFFTIFLKYDGNGSKWIASDQATSAMGKKWQVASFRDKGQPFTGKRGTMVKTLPSILHNVDQNVVESVKETFKGIKLKKEGQK